MKKIFQRAGLLAALGFASSVALATDFDGSKALICATIESHDCDVGATCLRGLPETIGAPQFLRIDFGKQTIVGPKRITPIQSIEKRRTRCCCRVTNSVTAGPSRSTPPAAS